jgi:RNA polymerase sigma-70 factor (ECF subfamily)
MESTRPAITLGDILYSSSSQALVSEKNWLRLVRSLAERDSAALHALYERTHRPVFTLILRLTGNRETAEELTLDLFDDLWRGSARYDASGTVLGWIMNQARSRAIDWLRLEQPAPANGEALKLDTQTRQLRAALNVLSPEERAALEIAFLFELTYVEVATRLKQTLGAIKARLRSALHKLRQAPLEPNRCAQSELVCAHAIGALPASEIAATAAHVASCQHCSLEWDSLRALVSSFVAWPTDLLRPAASLRERLARIAPPAADAALAQSRWSALEWEHVAPGIFCKLLATDTEKHLVSMLVRLVPGGTYPPHSHAGVEELHLLEGELWIGERKLHPGDYNRAEPGTSDHRVWSETGCTCVLVTSTRDALH